MPKSVFTDAYASFLEVLIAARKRQGVTQVELGARLGKPQTFISKIERGSRRLDVVEFFGVARAIGTDPVELFQEVAARLPDRIEL